MEVLFTSSTMALHTGAGLCFALTTQFLTDVTRLQSHSSQNSADNNLLKS